VKRAVFVVLWLTLVCGFAKTQPVGNETMVDSLLFKALDSLQVSRYFDSTGVQIILSSINPEKQAFCRTALIRYFNERHIPVFQIKKPAQLALETFSPKVEYFEPAKEILGFGSKVKRRISLRLSGWITASDATRGNVALEISLQKNDLVKKQQIPKLEESPYLFVKGKWVSYSRWTRFLQPAIVLGSVSVLVYLFFSLRS